MKTTFNYCPGKWPEYSRCYSASPPSLLYSKGDIYAGMMFSPQLSLKANMENNSLPGKTMYLWLWTHRDNSASPMLFYRDISTIFILPSLNKYPESTGQFYNSLLLVDTNFATTHNAARFCTAVLKICQRMICISNQL